jgi:hypothetical protein
MPRGGPRPNSGRKPGQATKKTREIADAAASTGLTPLEYMLSVMRGVDPLDPTLKVPIERRDDMANRCAPYIHPKLQAMEHRGNELMPIEARMSIEVKIIRPGEDVSTPAR